MSRQFEDAGRLNTEGRDSEPGEVFDGVNDFVALVEVDEIEGEKHADGVHALGGHNPKALVEPEFQLTDEPLETREGGVRRGDAKAEETLTGLVVNAVGYFFHRFLHFRA